MHKAPPVLAASLTVIALCATSVVFAPADSTSRSSPAKVAPGLVETTTSELVLIEVYVRDAEGRPVRGLTPEDFLLKVDQQVHPKKITSLEWVEPPAPAVTGGESEPPGAEHPSPSRHAWPRRFMLFFDDYNSTFIHGTQVRKAAMTYLARPGQASDQFALVSYDEFRKLRIAHDFTSDRADLMRTLEADLKDFRRFPDTDRQARADGARGPQDEDGRSANWTMTNLAHEDSSQSARILHLTQSLVDGLASWPGYKAIVYVGDGIPDNPAKDYHLPIESTSVVPEIGGLALAAGGSNVTLHSIQSTGIVAGGRGEVEAAYRRANVLRTLALDTGGIASSTNDFADALSRIDAAAEGYYVLSYVPEGPPDGRSHSVNLKLKDKVLDLRYRRFFTRFTPAQARVRAIEAAFVSPELHRDLGLDLVEVSGPPAGRGRLADLVIYVPPGKVLFLPDPEGTAARLEVGLVVLDPDRKEVLRLARDVRVSIDAAREAAGGGTLALNLYSRVKLPAAGGSVTAVVADKATGTIGAARVDVAASGAGQATGLSLYAVEEESLWVEIKPEDAPARRAGTVATRSIGPALRTRFAPNERVACGFQMAGSGVEAAPRDLHVEVLKADAVVRSRGVPITPHADGLPLALSGALSAEVPLAGLADGDYLLRLTSGQDPGTLEFGRLTFRIAAPDRR